MNQKCVATVCRSVLNGLTIVLLGGCALHPAQTAAPTYYLLDFPVPTTMPLLPGPSEQAPTLLISPMIAAPGYDSTHIIYTRTAHQLAYFARSVWIDTPTRMIAPLMAATLANSGTFRAVTPTTSAVAGELRLNTELVRLQHDFTVQPGQLRFTLRATVLDNATRKVLAWREFDEILPVASDAPDAGIEAANSAVQAGLQELNVFCSAVALQWRDSKNTGPRIQNQPVSEQGTATLGVPSI